MNPYFTPPKDRVGLDLAGERARPRIGAVPDDGRKVAQSERRRFRADESKKMLCEWECCRLRSASVCMRTIYGDPAACKVWQTRCLRNSILRAQEHAVASLSIF